MNKKIPTFKSDDEAERFVDAADLSEFDLSGAQLVRFEMKPKDKTAKLRLPAPLLLGAVRERAKRSGLPYQRFIRMALEEALRK